VRIDCAIEAPEAVTADVAIVGSGAAGQAAARRLLARGCSVVLLESGGLDHEDATADFNRGEIIGHEYHPLEHSRLRFFGGTTAIWGGRCAELDPIDLERREWVPHSGWPFDRAEIHNYLAEARSLLGVEAVDTSRLARPELLQRLSSEELAVRWWTFDPIFDRFTIDRAEDLDRDPRCTLMVHATVREIRLAQQRRRRPGVLVARVPRPARALGRLVAAVAEPDEERVGHSPSMARASSTVASRRPESSTIRAARATSSPLERAISPDGR